MKKILSLLVFLLLLNPTPVKAQAQNLSCQEVLVKSNETPPAGAYPTLLQCQEALEQVNNIPALTSCDATCGDNQHGFCQCPANCENSDTTPEGSSCGGESICSGETFEFMCNRRVGCAWNGFSCLKGTVCSGPTFETSVDNSSICYHGETGQRRYHCDAPKYTATAGGCYDLEALETCTGSTFDPGEDVIGSYVCLHGKSGKPRRECPGGSLRVGNQCAEKENVCAFYGQSHAVNESFCLPGSELIYTCSVEDAELKLKDTSCGPYQSCHEGRCVVTQEICNEQNHGQCVDGSICDGIGPYPNLFQACGLRADTSTCEFDSHCFSGHCGYLDENADEKQCLSTANSNLEGLAECGSNLSCGDYSKPGTLAPCLSEKEGNFSFQASEINIQYCCPEHTDYESGGCQYEDSYVRAQAFSNLMNSNFSVQDALEFAGGGPIFGLLTVDQEILANTSLVVFGSNIGEASLSCNEFRNDVQFQTFSSCAGGAIQTTLTTTGHITSVVGIFSLGSQILSSVAQLGTTVADDAIISVTLNAAADDVALAATDDALYNYFDDIVNAGDDLVGAGVSDDAALAALSSSDELGAFVAESSLTRTTTAAQATQAIGVQNPFNFAEAAGRIGNALDTAGDITGNDELKALGVGTGSISQGLEAGGSAVKMGVDHSDMNALMSGATN